MTTKGVGIHFERRRAVRSTMPSLGPFPPRETSGGVFFNRPLRRDVRLTLFQDPEDNPEDDHQRRSIEASCLHGLSSGGLRPFAALGLFVARRVFDRIGIGDRARSTERGTGSKLILTPFQTPRHALHRLGAGGPRPCAGLRLAVERRLFESIGIGCRARSTEPRAGLETHPDTVSVPDRRSGSQSSARMRRSVATMARLNAAPPITIA